GPVPGPLPRQPPGRAGPAAAGRRRRRRRRAPRPRRPRRGLTRGSGPGASAPEKRVRDPGGSPTFSVPTRAPGVTVPEYEGSGDPPVPESGTERSAVVGPPTALVPA